MTSHDRAVSALPPSASGPGGAKPLPARVVVIGTSGAGKSTLGVPLATMLGAEFTELDRFQHGPNWAQATPEEFREKALSAAQAPRWVFDGNYIDRIAADLWPRAELIVWLNPPLPVILQRLLRRSLTRIILRSELWQGNREGWGAVFGRNSVLAWAARSNRRHVKELPGRLAALADQGVQVVRLRSGAEARVWLQTMEAAIRSRVGDAVAGSVLSRGEGALDADQVLPADCAALLAATFPNQDRVVLIDQGGALPGAEKPAPAWRAVVDALLATPLRGGVIRAATRRIGAESSAGSEEPDRAAPGTGSALTLRFDLGTGHGALTVEYAAGE
jgi:adenylate kinase family enzyme